MERTIIIAEAGVNHNGDINLAKKLIDAAAKANVDYVKFQTFKSDKVVSKSAKRANYQKKYMGDGDTTQYEMLKNLELSEDQHLELVAYCLKKGVKFFSTAFDLDSVQFLSNLGFDLFKIPSGEVTNYPYLRAIAKLKKSIVMSTGMCSMTDIENAIGVLTKYGAKKKDLTILHCNTQYPTPMKDVNLKAMLTIAEKFDVKFGYSDHTTGIEVSTAAVALGATVIEKHFTLDRTMDGPDHKASLEPNELNALVQAIRNVEIAIRGSGEKRPSPSEIENMIVARKSIHLASNLQRDAIIKEEDLITLRPGDGISPMHWKEIIGKRLVKRKMAFEKLEWEDLQ